MSEHSRNSLDGEIIKIHRGLAIYKTHASPFWNARVRDPQKKGYTVKSTKETSRIKAREAAVELEAALAVKAPSVPSEVSFRYYADQFIKKATSMVAQGERNPKHVATARFCLENGSCGLLKHFGSLDVRQLKTRHWSEYARSLLQSRPDLSSSTRGTLSATFRNVLKVALEDGVIDQIPDTPRTAQRDNPRSFFRFYPVVTKKNDEYKLLLKTTKAMADAAVCVRGNPITDELYDLVLFLTHSFVRPTTTELYALRHDDIQVAENPKRLLITIRRGKTGFRVANSMQAAVSVYQRIQKRYPQAKGEDYLFLPDYRNRSTASRIIARQINEVLEKAGLNHDPVTNTDRTIYSLRHTAICMRIILSEGNVNIYNLAKTAGTSVDQIERFYTKHLPLSAEMARNLQSFGTKT